MNQPLKRLSLDIDLDLNSFVTKEQLNEVKENIKVRISNYLKKNEYNLVDNSRFSYALMSLIFNYRSVFNCNDQLKFDVNVMDRCHIMPIDNITIKNIYTDQPFTVAVLNPYELFGTKISALISRSLPRDLYDVYQMIISKKLPNIKLLSRCLIFYDSISGTSPGNYSSFTKIEQIDYFKIRQQLKPVLYKEDEFDYVKAKEIVLSYLSGLLTLDGGEKAYLSCFKKGEYRPDLLFEDKDIVERIKNHPMALWRCMNQGA